MAATPYEELEDAVIAALAPLATLGVLVALWPDEEAEFVKTFSKPTVYVRYHSFTPGDQLSVSTTTAEKPSSVQLTFQAKKTRGVLGVFDMQVKAEDLLRGLLVPGFKRITIGEFTFGDRTKEGVWSYNQLLKTTGTANQKIDDISSRFAIPGL